MIYASAIEAMGLSVFADGQSLHEALLKITGVVTQNCFQAVFQIEQVALEFPEVLFQYPDVPLFLDAESVLGFAEPISLTELLGIFIVGIGVGPVPIVILFNAGICPSLLANETVLLKTIRYLRRNPHLGLPFEFSFAHTTH